MSPEHLKDALNLARRHNRPFLARTHTTDELVAAARRVGVSAGGAGGAAASSLSLWMAVDGAAAGGGPDRRAGRRVRGMPGPG